MKTAAAGFMESIPSDPRRSASERFNELEINERAEPRRSTVLPNRLSLAETSKIALPLSTGLFLDQVPRGYV